MPSRATAEPPLTGACEPAGETAGTGADDADAPEMGADGDGAPETVADDEGALAPPSVTDVEASGTVAC